MTSKKNKSENASKQDNISLKIEDNNIYIYCITSFNSKITNAFDLIAKNSEVSSIKTLLKIPLKYNNYDFIVHEICANKKIKNLNLYLNDTKISYDLNSITIKSTEQKIVLLDDLIVIQNSINDLANKLALKKSVNVFKYININEKFNTYMQSFEEQGNKDELKILLASKILSTLKKNKEIKFSVLISLFNIIFENKLITKFLSIYPKLDIDFDDNIGQNEEFNTKILKLYEKNTKKFFEKNLKFISSFQKSTDIKNKEDSLSEEKYKNLLENFVVLYKLIYKDKNNIEQQKLINVREIVFNLMDNKHNLFKILNFIIFRFDVFSLLLSKENDIRYKIKPYLGEFSAEIEYQNFKGIYESLLTNKFKTNIFDFSEVFNYFATNLNNLEQLISLKNLYKKELSSYPNEYFKENIIRKIHKIGVKEIMNGTYSNIQILYYLKNNDIYCKKDCKIVEFKDYEILKKLKIELMNDSFFEKFHKDKIYSFFEENYEKYLSMFPSIDKMKYFGLFFKLLPPELYQKQTELFVFNWLMKNLNTYNRLDCPNFKNEIKTFYSILNKSSKYLLPKLIEKLEEFLSKDCNELFVFLINAFTQNIGQNELELMINYIIFKNKKEEMISKIILDNLYTFLKKVKPSKLITKTLLNIIGNLSITHGDFFDENNYKFDLLNNILNRKEYSIFEETENKNCQYWLNTIEESKEIYENLKNLNFIFQNILISFKYIGEKTLEQRTTLVAICLGREDYESFSSSKVNELKMVLEKWENNANIIQKIVNIYK